MKKWMVVVAGVLAALVVLGVTKDLIIKTAVESGVRKVTGLKLEIGAFRAGLFNSVIDIRNLKILNPSGFKDSAMLDMPEIYVKYYMPAIFSGKVHVKEARLHLKEFIVEKNEKGQLNLNSLRVVKAEKSGTKPSAQAGGKAPQIQIDKLRLIIGKAYYKDYTTGGAPRVMEYNVNLDEEYTNITDPYSLVSLIVIKTLANTSISRMANFDINGLSGTVSDVLDSTHTVTKQAMDTAKTATDAAKQAQDVVKGVSDTFKNVFGSGK